MKESVNKCQHLPSGGYARAAEVAGRPGRVGSVVGASGSGVDARALLLLLPLLLLLLSGWRWRGGGGG